MRGAVRRRRDRPAACGGAGSGSPARERARRLSGHIDDLVAGGEIGGRTVRILETGEVDCHSYPIAPLIDGAVRVRSARTAISPGTELTYIGRSATNPYLHRRWDPELRLFVDGAPSVTYPIVFGYRAAGIVVESRTDRVTEGTRVFGNWRHTEFTTLAASDALAQLLPTELSFDDGVDLAQMLPIAVNAVAFSEGRHAAGPAVVFGCGPVGLLVGQVAKATGAAIVYAVDRLPARLDIARSVGLEPLSADGDVAARLKHELGPEAVPVAFECTGSPAALGDAIRVVRRRGTVVAVGFYQGDASGLRLGEEFHHNGVEIRSGQIGNLHPSFDSRTLRARSLELALSGRIVLGGLPRLEVPVDDAGSGFAALRRPAEVLQVVFSYV
ncbi:MAG: zinc-binding dehydrogenase [Chloroflexi bacterium]|nr:MAG: zinc-binding dehydrogenase [Chloroflexota bacterium]